MTRTTRFFWGIVLASTLAGCGREAPQLQQSHGKTVAEWVEALRHADPKVRKKAVVALGHAGAADPAAVSALAGAVKDRDAGVRDAAVLALLNLGPAAREAVPALESAAQDRDPKVRDHAAKALARVRRPES